jgi:hypothetical protein
MYSDPGIQLTPAARRALDALFPPRERSEPTLAAERAVYERAVADEQAAHRAGALWAEFGQPATISRHELAKTAREEHSHGRRKLTRRARKARRG